MGDLFEALRGKGLHVLVLEDCSEAFIIGDEPIVPMIPEGKTLNDADAANLFPIAWDVAVACSGGSLDEELALLPKGSDGARLLRNINLAILEQSSTVAARSERLIQSLTRERRWVAGRGQDRAVARERDDHGGSRRLRAGFRHAIDGRPGATGGPCDQCSYGMWLLSARMGRDA